jgi:hypothetical protein
MDHDARGVRSMWYDHYRSELEYAICSVLRHGLETMYSLGYHSPVRARHIAAWALM